MCERKIEKGSQATIQAATREEEWQRQCALEQTLEARGCSCLPALHSISQKGRWTTPETLICLHP